MSHTADVPTGMSAHPILDDAPRRKRGVITFLALSFIPCWISWFVLHALGFSLSNPIVQLGGAFMPAIAAIIVRKWVTREGFSDAGMRLRFRKSWRQYLTVMFLPLLMLGCMTLVAVLGGFVEPSKLISSGTILFVILSPLIVIAAAPIYWGEEFGWTSYLRMRLAPRSPLRATLYTGIIWGVWHWPLVFTGYFDDYDVSSIGTIVGQMALWVVLCVLLEIILSWSYWKSGTIWTTSILHAGNNLVVSTGSVYIATQGTGISLNMSTVLFCLGILPLALILLWPLLKNNRTA